MKSLLIHFAKEQGDGRLELAGRCCEDPIFIQDELVIEGKEWTRLRVLTIDVYGKQVNCLERGYVGYLIVQHESPYAPFMRLTGCQPSSENV